MTLRSKLGFGLQYQEKIGFQNFPQPQLKASQQFAQHPLVFVTYFFSFEFILIIYFL